MGIIHFVERFSCLSCSSFRLMVHRCGVMVAETSFVRPKSVAPPPRLGLEDSCHEISLCKPLGAEELSSGRALSLHATNRDLVSLYLAPLALPYAYRPVIRWP